MNAAAYLHNQGWRGQGYSLDKSNRGLAKPLLVAQKDDQAGLGNKKHDFENQWWTDAFDRSLKQLGSETQNTAPPIASIALSKRYSLYSNFIKAETLASTISISNSSSDEAREDQTVSRNGNSTMSLSGIPSDISVAPAAASEEIGKEMKKSHKRKHEADSGETKSEKRSSKKSKKQKHDTSNERLESEKQTSQDIPAKTAGPLEHGEDFIPLLPDDQTEHASLPMRSKTSKKPKKGEKTANQENNDRIKAEITAAIANGTYVEPPPPGPDPARELRGPPHPESIMALRQSGETVDLPGDRTDPNQLRYQLITALENGRDFHVKQMLKRAMPTVDPNDPAQNNGQVPAKKVSYKSEKYKREKAKREAKRDARHWIDVRANTHLYRPDGTYIVPRDRGVSLDEIKAKRQTDKEAKLRANIEKKARQELKEQMKTERRLARKRIRGEKKTQNHIEQQAKYSAKVQRQKREKDEAAAAEAGLTYEAFVEAREQQKREQKEARDRELAKTEGISYEELLERRRKLHEEQLFAAEAKKLGLTPEEYANQQADVTDELVGMDNPSGAASGMGQHHGRSPIDRLWEKYKPDPSAEDESKPDAESASDDDSDASSNSSDEDSDGGVALSAPSQTNGTHSSEAAAAAEAKPLYVIDTVGSKGNANDGPPDPNAPKRVKDLTKEERKARLEQIRKRRAERNAREGVTKMSKKERRKRRAQQKEEILNKITNDLIKKKKEQERARAAETGSEAPEVKTFNSKQSRKQSRREARKLMRGAKKGTLPEDQIPPQLVKKGNQKPKKKKSRGRR